MTELQISESHLVQQPQTVRDFVDVAEERNGFAHGHVQHVVDVLAAIAHVKNLLLEARAFAFLANQLNVSQKLHFDGDGAVALANFAAAARHVE